MTHPRALPLEELAAPFSRADLSVSIAAPVEFDEVEALARTADPHDVFAPVTAKLLSWLVDDNPHGPGFLVVARSPQDHAIVGHFLFYATTLVHAGDGGDAVFPAYLYVNLYVTPAFRRKGVFAAMFGFGQAVLRRMGVSFSYTVPNQRSSPGFAKFGVPRLGSLPCWMAPTWAGWRACAAVTSWGDGVDVSRVLAFAEELIPAHGPQAGVHGLRTADALNWRFGRRPGVDYAVWCLSNRGHDVGYAVTRVMTIQRYRVLALCDLMLDRYDAAAIRSTIAGVVRQTADDRTDLVMLQGGPPQAGARLALWRAGLVHVPDRLLPQPIVVFGGTPGETGSTAGLPRLNRWHLTPGDWDVF